LPKFNMYRKILSNILSKDFVQTKRSSINEAVDLGKLLLRGNSETIFKMH